MSKAIFLKPRMSEKAYNLSEQQRTYVFDIPASTSKQVVAAAVADQYEVSVASVRIAKTAPKSRRTTRRGGRVRIPGQSAGVRKAYVQLAEGQTLPIFAAVKEEQEQEAELASKAKKASAKSPKSGKTTIKPDKTADKPAKIVTKPSKAPAKKAAPATELASVAPAKPERETWRQRFGFRPRGNK